MVSKLFVLSIAQLCTKKIQTEGSNSFNVKYEVIKTTRILLQKKYDELVRKMQIRGTFFD